jgi:hypothetical protein
VRALATEQLQTPLCHVALLCTNRKTPNMAGFDVIARFEPFEGKFAHLIVEQNDFTVEAANPEDAAAWLAQQSSRRLDAPPLAFNFEASDLLFVRDALSQETIKSIGSKAANLGCILAHGAELNNQVNMLAFVVPFSYWRDFVTLVAPEEYQEIRKPETVEGRALCAILRSKIESGSIGEWRNLREQFLAKLREWDGVIPFGQSADGGLSCNGLILRSSTNCEDLPGFPSAGLYHSDAVPVFEWNAIERGILRVWASVFSDRAYLERREYGIAEENVGMAILVMPLLRDCVFANGVVVTANPYRPDLGGMLFNVQTGTTAVTDACGGAIPEQIVICNDGTPLNAFQIISQSSLLPPGQFILKEDIAQQLAQSLQDFDLGIFESRRSCANALDAEFFILKNNDLVVVQVRPIEVQVRKEKEGCLSLADLVDEDDFPELKGEMPTVETPTVETPTVEMPTGEMPTAKNTSDVM